MKDFLTIDGINNSYFCYCGYYYKTSTELLDHIRSKRSVYHYAVQSYLPNCSSLACFIRKTENGKY